MTDAPKDYAPGDDPLNTGDVGQGSGGRINREAAERAAAEIRKRVEEGAAAARTWAADQSAVLRGQVAERPLAAVGISAGAAFAAGLVVGILLASSRR
jgi:ElaB/YqjD/DUF883 family membrane-anchored ribosome-binding protein